MQVKKCKEKELATRVLVRTRLYKGILLDIEILTDSKQCTYAMVVPVSHQTRSAPKCESFQTFENYNKAGVCD